MAIFFLLLFSFHKSATFTLKDLAYAELGFRILRKQNQMNCESQKKKKKTSQNNILPILSEMREKT